MWNYIFRIPCIFPNILFGIELLDFSFQKWYGELILKSLFPYKPLENPGDLNMCHIVQGGKSHMDRIQESINFDSIIYQNTNPFLLYRRNKHFRNSCQVNIFQVQQNSLEVLTRKEIFLDFMFHLVAIRYDWTQQWRF